MNHVLHRSLTAHLAVVLIASLTSTTWAQHHPSPESAATQETAPAGDPYTLDVDPVTGDKLPDIAEQIIIDHEGRELRFGSTESVEQFNADPGKFLPPVDEQIIKQQLPYYPMETCVVSGDKIGGDMGDPVDFVYKNRLVRLCCKGCKGDLKDNPANYLGKLDEAVKQQQMQDYPLITCPVSGGQLGVMGDPIDVVIANRLVRLCCDGCIDKLRDNPTKYLGMLDEAGAEDADHHEDGKDHSKHDTDPEDRDKSEDEGHGHAGHDRHGQ